MAVVKKIDNMFNDANLIDVAGLLYIAADYDENGSKTWPEGDGSNNQTSIDEMASYNYDEAGFFIDATMSQTQENERVIESDACNREEIAASVDVITTFTVTLQEMGNIELMARILGCSIQEVAAAPQVGLTLDKLFTGYTEFGKVIDFTENTAGSITSVTGSVDGALTLTTDYSVETDADGSIGIELVSGGTITTLNQTFTVVYDQTPKAKKQLVLKNGQRTLPYLLLRFVQCEKNASGEKNRVHYFAKARISSELTVDFVNQSRNDFAGSTVTFTVAKDGNYAQTEITNP